MSNNIQGLKIMDNTDKIFTFEKILLDMQLRVYDSVRIDFNNKNNCFRFSKKLREYKFKNLNYYYMNNNTSLYIYPSDLFLENYICYRYIDDKNFKVIKVGQDGKLTYF